MDLGELCRLRGILVEHPQMVGVGIDEQTAAVVQGQTLSVVGNAGIWMYLAATPTLPVSEQRLRSGDHLDLLSLSQTLAARTPSKPDKSAVTIVTPMREPAMGMGR